MARLKQTKTIILGLILIGISPIIHAQKTMGLQECIKTAINNNQDIKRALLNFENSENDVQISKTAKYPTLDAGIYQGANFGRSIDRFTNAYINQLYNSTYGNIQFSLPIFTGFRNQSNVAASKELMEAGKLNIETAKNALILQVLQAYFTLMTTQELLEIAQSQFESSKNQLERLKKMIDAGTINKLEYNQAFILNKNDAFSIIDAKNNVGVARLNLLQLMNMREENNISFERVTLPVTYDGSQENDLFKIKDKLPELQSLKFQMHGTDYRIKAAKSRNKPQIDLFSNYSLFYASSNPTRNFGEQLNDTRNGSINLGLSIPIGRRFITAPIVQSLKIQKQLLNNTFQNTEIIIDKNIEMAQLLYKNASQSFENANEQVGLNEESLTLIEKRLDAGTIQFIEYTVAKNNLEQAASRKVQAKYRVMLQSIILDFYSKGAFDF